LFLANAPIIPAGAEGESAAFMLGGMFHEQVVVDLVLVDGVEAEDTLRFERAMHAGDAGLQPLEPGAVVDGVQEAGNQVHRLAQPELAHILQRKARFGAANGRSVQHGLVDVEPGAVIAVIDEMTNMRPSSTGQIEMPGATVTEKLLQPMNAVALRLIVDIGAHQVVITG